MMRYFKVKSGVIPFRMLTNLKSRVGFSVLFILVKIPIYSGDDL